MKLVSVEDFQEEFTVSIEEFNESSLLTLLQRYV
jgi:hypothetical protein